MITPIALIIILKVTSFRNFNCQRSQRITPRFICFRYFTMYGVSDYFIILQLLTSVLSLCSVICQIIVLQSTFKCFQYSLFSFSILNSLLHLVIISLSDTFSPHVYIAMIGLSVHQGSFQVIILALVVMRRPHVHRYILAETI